MIQLLLFIALGSCGLFWTGRIALSAARTSYAHSSALFSDGTLINGARIDLEHDASITRRSGHVTAPQRTLLLVVSDSCPGVSKLMPTWQELLTSLPADGSVEVQVLTLGGEARSRELMAIVEERGVLAAMYSVHDLRHFERDTGINSTPYTIVLDANHRARGVSIGTELQARAMVGGAIGGCLAGRC